MALPVENSNSLDFLPKSYYDIGHLGDFGPNDRLWWGVFQVVFEVEQNPPEVEGFVIVENTSSFNFFYKALDLTRIFVCEGVYPAVFSQAEVTKAPFGEWYHTTCNGEMRAKIFDAYDKLRNLPNAKCVYLCTAIPNENMLLVDQDMLKSFEPQPQNAGEILN